MVLRWRSISILALLAVGALLLAARASPGTIGQKGEVCGTLPGEGAYSYVKVWNIGCARARNVATTAYERFCEPPETCSIDPVGEFVRGQVSFRGWSCGLKLGYEFSRVRCERPGKRLVQESAA